MSHGEHARTLAYRRDAGVRRQPVAGDGQCPLPGVSRSLSRAAVWRLLVAGGRIAQPATRRGMRFVFGAITAVLVIAVALSFRTLNGLAAGTALLTVMGALKLLEVPRTTRRRDRGRRLAVPAARRGARHAGAVARCRSIYSVVWGACAAIAMIADRNGALTTRRGGAALGARAGDVDSAGRRLLPVFPAGRRAVLGARARRSGDEPGCPTRCRPAASASSPSNTIRRFGCGSKALRRPAKPCTGAARCSTASMDSPGGASASRMYSAARPRPCSGAPIRYRITLEPTNRQWLFALDTVAEAPRRDMFMSHDRQLSMFMPITSTLSYDAVSHLETRDDGHSVDPRTAPRDRAAARPQSARAPAGARPQRRAPRAMPPSREPCSTGSATTASNTRSSPARPRSTPSTPRCSTASAASAATSLPRTR